MKLIENTVQRFDLFMYSVAAAELAQQNNIEEGPLLLEMAGAVRNGELKVRDPKTGAYFVVDAGMDNPSPYVTIQDVNDWLSSNGYPYQWQIISNKPNLALTPTIIPKPVLKSEIALLFADAHFTRDKWKKYLADPPKWLEKCRIAKGTKSIQSTWNPVKIALELSGKRVQMPVLNKIMKKLPEWAEDWAEKSEFLRSY